MHSPPVALTIAGSDPSGGAGIQADLTTFARLGVHGATAITAITVQDSRNVIDFDVLPTRRIVEQTEIVLADCSVAAIKLGMLGSADTVEAIAHILAQHPTIPVVLDPVMVAGGGGELATEAVVEKTRSRLLPLATLITPNLPEASRLSCGGDPAFFGARLHELGARNILITGGDALESSPTSSGASPIQNLFYRENGSVQIFELERLPYSYHGSGCTLASAITAFLAHGHNLETAITEALDFMNRAVSAGYAPGKGQHVPNRLCPASA